MRSRLTERQYIALIALISTAVLIFGVLLKPKQLPEPTISGEEILRLQTLTQKRNLDNLAVYFSEVASGIQSGLVWLNEFGMTGLVWNQDGLIVTAGTNQSASTGIMALTSMGDIALEAEILSGSFRVSSLKAPRDSGLQPVHKGTTRGLTSGTWILQIARQAGGNYLFTPAVYGGVVSQKCGASEYQTLQSNFPLTESALGGGLFDLDGNLLAVVLRCDDRFAAVMPSDVDLEIARATSFEGKLLRGYGFQVTGLDDVSRRYFRIGEGVMVREVTDGQAADAASLMPGDVIAALDKAPVRSPDDLRRLVTTQDHPVFQMEVQRNQRSVRIELRPTASQTSDELPGTESRGIGLADPAQGYLVDTVIRGSSAERASIEAGDRLLLVDGHRAANGAALRKILSGQNQDPIFVVLRRGSRKIGTFLK